MRLPLREFDLLANLARVPDRPLSRDALLRAVWRIDFDPGTNRVEVHMSRLRAKVDRRFDWPMLPTVEGHGYALRSRPDYSPPSRSDGEDAARSDHDGAARSPPGPPLTH